MDDSKINWNSTLEKANEVEMPMDNVNEVPPVEKKKFNIQKYLKLIIVAIVGLIIIVGAIVILFVINNLRQRVEEGGENTNLDPSVVVDESSVSESTNENLGINPVEPPFHINESTDSSKKNNTDPVIAIKMPIIAQTSEYNIYSYAISVNEPAFIKYPSGFTYDINLGNCKEAESFYSDSDLFSGNITNPMFGDNTVILKINKVFLTNTSLASSNYEIKDLDGNVIGRGTVGIPNCKGVIESFEKKGSFYIEGPEIVDSKVPGYSNYKYVFYPDDIAKKALEKGFTSKIYHNCDSWLDEDPMYKEWDAGKMGYLGINFDLDNDSIYKDVSEKTSVYEIRGSDGNILFQGYIPVPNCR